MANKESEAVLGSIENYLIDHESDPVIVSFAEGDSYLCEFDTDDWEDGDMEPTSSEYDEWLVLVFQVEKVIQAGPNKDPRYDFISISEKHMPSKISCGDVVLYNADAK